MRKPIVLLTALALAPVFVATDLGSGNSTGPTDRWDGGDDLPTNPLPCGDEEAPPPEGEMPEYDGGQPTDTPDKAGQPITLVDIPKLIGIGYFNATAQGMQEAAASSATSRSSMTAPRSPTSTSRSRSSTTTSPRAWTACSSPPTTRWRSLRS